jgi:hypothetical protein
MDPITSGAPTAGSGAYSDGAPNLRNVTIPPLAQERQVIEAHKVNGRNLIGR